MEDVVEAAVLVGVLDGQEVLDFFYYADYRGFALGVGADPARGSLGEVAALLAGTHPFHNVGDGPGEGQAVVAGR